jgi:hypothetical protein
MSNRIYIFDTDQAQIYSAICSLQLNLSTLAIPACSYQPDFFHWVIWASSYWLEISTWAITPSLNSALIKTAQALIFRNLSSASKKTPYHAWTMRIFVSKFVCKCTMKNFKGRLWPEWLQRLVSRLRMPSAFWKTFKGRLWPEWLQRLVSRLRMPSAFWK